jgi:hypothetical protein
MREVDSMDDDHEPTSEIKYPQYPLDIMDKLWDEYHDARDGKLPSGNKIIPS